MSRDFEIHNLSNLTEEELWESVDELKSMVEGEIEWREECAEEKKAAAIEEKARAIREKELTKYAVYRYVTDIERTYIKAKTVKEAHKLALKNIDHNSLEILPVKDPSSLSCAAYWKKINAQYENRIPIEKIHVDFTDNEN